MSEDVVPPPGSASERQPRKTKSGGRRRPTPARQRFVAAARKVERAIDKKDRRLAEDALARLAELALESPDTDKDAAKSAIAKLRRRVARLSPPPPAVTNDELAARRWPRPMCRRCKMSFTPPSDAPDQPLCSKCAARGRPRSVRTVSAGLPGLGRGR